MKRIAILAAGAVLALPLSARADLTDPDDIAKVDEIDTKVDDQLDQLADLQGIFDQLLEFAEHEHEEAEGLAAFGDALLEVDLSRLMLAACPRPASSARGACSAAAGIDSYAESQDHDDGSACLTCTNPRLMISDADGGYLDTTLDMIQRAINRAAEFGLDADLVRAQELLDRAMDLAASGDGDGSLDQACMSFGELACVDDDDDDLALSPYGRGAASDFSSLGGYSRSDLRTAARRYVSRTRGYGTAPAAARGPGGTAELLDPALALLAIKVDLVSSQLDGAESQLELFLDQMAEAEAIGHEATESLEDARVRKLEEILLACARNPSDCVDPNLLNGALNESCQDYSAIGSPGHPLRLGTGSAEAIPDPTPEDHIPEFGCLLREIIFIVFDDIEAAEAMGLARDIVRAQEELDEAIHHGEEGEGRTAFEHACAAFSAIACRSEATSHH